MGSARTVGITDVMLAHLDVPPTLVLEHEVSHRDHFPAHAAKAARKLKRMRCGWSELKQLLSERAPDGSRRLEAAHGSVSYNICFMLLHGGRSSTRKAYECAATHFCQQRHAAK